MQATQKTIAVLMTTALMAIAAPALADNDEYHYEQNRSQYISYDAAREAAIKAVGGGTATDIDFEYKARLNQAYFEVEVVAPNGTKYEVKIDAKTGAKISQQRDF